jgi:hypothetical protein
VTFSFKFMRGAFGRNFDVTIGRATRKACSATWNLGTDSPFALEPRNTTENLNQVDRSQDLPDAFRLLACSPAFKTRTLTSVPICAVVAILRVLL